MSGGEWEGAVRGRAERVGGMGGVVRCASCSPRPTFCFLRRFRAAFGSFGAFHHMASCQNHFFARLRWLGVLSAAALLSACSAVRFDPVETLDQVRLGEGYRLQRSLDAARRKEDFIVMMISGGGTRAAAFGYGLLEALEHRPLPLRGRRDGWLENIDVVYGVSGGAVLAAYLALHGRDTIPDFENRFLKQNFERLISRQALSLANMPRLASPEFGRGDLLQEQFENTLFGNATFDDLARRRKGPFAVISATDMTAGRRIDFTQEYFDILCLNLSDLRIARAVAASSAVPLVFAPLTLNNNGGNCGYALPENIRQAVGKPDETHALRRQTRREYLAHIGDYARSQARPYLHLIDGGLTDNLGLRHLLEMNEIYAPADIRYRFLGGATRRVVVIVVNAQNQVSSDIDRSAAVPGLMDALNATINIPIDQHSQESLRRFRALVDEINTSAYSMHGDKVKAYFISLGLHDLPESPLRQAVLNIPTSFYLPREDINLLKSAASTLLDQSAEYQRLRADLEEEAAARAVDGARCVPAAP